MVPPMQSPATQPPAPGQYAYFLCQQGAEPALKREIAASNPELKFAFSRPGFLTYKSTQPLDPEFAPELILARAFGLTLGKARGDLPAVVQAARAELRRLEPLAPGATFRLHVSERDFFDPGVLPPGYDPFSAPRELEAALRADPELKPRFRAGAPANGDWVFDVIRIEAGATKDEPVTMRLTDNEVWFGFHRHTPMHPSFAGGRFAGPLPQAAPSRAYLKLEEAAHLYLIPLKKGDTTVEIGSAPGGASFALVQRGLNVVGIDPGAMEPAFLENAGRAFQHLRKPVLQVDREELPKRFEWLLLDMNVDPETALPVIEEWVPVLEGKLKGVILTLKLNDWSLTERIPGYLERLRALGLTRLRARQLSSNKQEFCVYGLTRAGLRGQAGGESAP
jgi:23S rRNA (cytidine2498-2'-O)-methyltransferase